MEGVKGLHALATFIAVPILVWILYPFLEVLLNFPSDVLQGYLYWGSLIMVVLVGTIAVPYLIAMRYDSTASIGSAFMALGVWGGAILFNTLAFPVFNAFVNIFTDIEAGVNALGDPVASIFITNFTNAGLVIQLLSIFWILVVLATLYLLPLIVALNPGIITDRLKKTMNL